MMDLSDFQTLIAQSFLGGSETAAGLIIFSAVMVAVLALVKRPFLALVVMLPVTILFNVLGIIATDLTVILVIVVVLGLAVTSSKALR